MKSCLLKRRLSYYIQSAINKQLWPVTQRYLKEIIPVLTMSLVYFDSLLFWICELISFWLCRNCFNLILLELIWFCFIFLGLFIFENDNFYWLLLLFYLLLIANLLNIFARLSWLSLMNNAKSALDIRLNCFKYFKMLVAFLYFLQEVLQL